MKKEFWLEKWQNQQIGFHKPFVHPLLQKYVKNLQLQQGDTIFVPLCGKTLDLLWLQQQGLNVIGCELSQLAVQQFFAENNLAFDKTEQGNFMVYKSDNISIYQGDFFKLDSIIMQNCKAIYDRAALIALPDDMVGNYVKKLRNIMPDNCMELLITLEFIKTVGPLGPPFSTSNGKVEQLFKHANSLKLLYEEDIIQRETRFAEMGCQYLWERVYLIKF